MSGRVGSITTEIITDGLVLNLDAANRASYPKTGTTALDTIGNISTTLQSSGMFENVNAGVFTFDGASDQITISSANSGPIYDIGTGDFTSTIWTSAASGMSSYSTMFSNWNSSKGLLLWKISSGKFQCYIGGTAITPNFIVPQDDTWHNYVVTRKGTSISIYIDNGSPTTGTSSGDLEGNNTTKIANFNGHRWKGKIANTQFYNRALSSQEVAQNYNALKGRFGLS